jgi:hypothetical protein
MAQIEDENNSLNNSNNQNDISIKILEGKENHNKLIDAIDKNNKNIISFNSTNDTLKISSKSIKKIFSLMTNDLEKLSDIYLDHVTINIFDFVPNQNTAQSNNDKMTNSKIENMELDVKYKTVLDKTTIFNINLGNNISTENNLKSNIRIERKSLQKIFTYLNESIIGMSDYINLIILYLQKENQSDLAKLVIEQKILGKYYKEPKKLASIEIKKDLNNYINIPVKNRSQNIYSFDMLFNKVLDYIDDYDKESSFSDNINNIIIPRKNINDDLIQTANVCFVEEGILTDGRTSPESRKRNNSNIHTNQDICNKDLCNGMCNIF